MTNMNVIEISLHIIMPFNNTYGILNLNSVIRSQDYDAEISSKSAINGAV